MAQGLRSVVELVCLVMIVMSAVEAAKLRRNVGDGSSGRRHGGTGNGLAVHQHRAARGLCATMGQCCQGKDNQCRAATSPSGGAKRNQKTVDGNSTSTRRDEDGCFCDAACLELGDCCVDYKEACKPVDCILADEWDEYGECDTRCGHGIRQRRRRVLQRPLNGGQPCGKTVEKVPCEGTNCKVARAPNGHEELGETAYIIPSIYGTWRKSKRYDPFSDIRRNLFEHYDAKNLIRRPPYCTVFELTEVRSGCNLTSALVGSSGTSPDIAAINWVSQLVKGSSVCVECQPSVMKKKLGGRCRGHGVLAKETRWDAVTVPGCRGRWVMKSRKEECQCGGGGDSDNKDANFILV